MHMAAEYGHKEILRLLIEHKADVSANTTDGLTALFRAAQNKHKTAAQLLLEHKVDVDARTTDG